MSTQDDGLEIEFTLTRGDYAALLEHLAGSDPVHISVRQEGRIRVMWIGVAWAAQSFLAVVGVLLLINRDRDSLPHGPALLLAALIAAYSSYVLVVLIRRLGSIPAAEFLRGMVNEHSLGLRRVGLTSEGVRLRTAAVDALNRWIAVGDIDQTPELLIIGAQTPNCIIIPRRAFPRTEACAAFVAAFHSMKAASGDGINLLAAYLARRDVACPRCGYNLRDLTGFKCPECGVSLTFGGLWAADRPDASGGADLDDEARGGSVPNHEVAPKGHDGSSTSGR